MSLVFPNLEVQNTFIGTRYVVIAATTDDLNTTTGEIWTYSGANQTLTSDTTSTTTLDGVTLSDNDRVLIKNQTSAIQNGIYIAHDTGAGAATVLTRADDLRTGESANSRLAWVQSGTTQSVTAYVCTSPPGTDVVNTDNLTWAQYDVVDTLSIARGGTNQTTFTTDRLITYDGTSLTSTTIDPNTVITGGTGTDNHIVRWDGTGTTTIQDSTNAQIDDTDNISGLANISLSGDILDANSNELIDFVTTGSAVNSISITNAATGTNPIIGGVGDDANVGIDFQAKGTGTYNFLATASNATGIRWYEDTDNGTNYMEFEAAAAITTDFTLVWPDGVGTAGQFLQTDGNNPATLSWVSVSATDLWFQILSIAARANNNNYNTICYFPWDDSAIGGTTTRTVTVWAETGNRSLDVQVWDGTTQLGTVNVPTSTTGISTFTFTDPGADARLEFRIRKGANGGNNPTVYGILLQVSAS